MIEPTLDILDWITVNTDEGPVTGSCMGMHFDYTKQDWIYSIKVCHRNYMEEIQVEGQCEVENPHGDAGFLPPTRFGFQA